MENKILRASKDTIGKSYEWTNSRGTFPSSCWVDIICEYLTQKDTKTNLQKKYKKFLVKSHQGSRDNNMHINVLLNKLQISKDQDFEYFKRIDHSSLVSMVKEYISSILNEMEKENITLAWQEQIINWKKQN